MFQQPLELSEDFKYCLDTIEKTDKSMFITGRAGTGKSTLLQLFRNATKKKTVVLAPTGIAALNVQGQTVHSFFGFPPRLLNKRDIKKRNRHFLKLYKRIEVIIIDEVSMIRADMMDNIDYFLRINRDSHLPFGGVQMIFFGDLFQLPPIVSTEVERNLFTNHYDSPYFFSAKVLEQDNFEMEKVELRRVYRQEARHFVRLLDAVRTNQIDYDDLEDLNERHMPEFQAEDFYITLSARNATVNNINRKALEKIPLPSISYTAKVTGSFEDRRFPTDLILNLKLTAQVMFIKNDPDKAFVNGTIGKITILEEDKITVMIEDEPGKRRYVDVQKMDWEILRYKPVDEVNEEGKTEEIKTETLGTFTQYPLKLAWALTIHKAQGKTFDKVIIDMGKGAFEHGQTYVALSRCRTLDGIILKKPLGLRDVMVDERIVEYYERYF